MAKFEPAFGKYYSAEGRPAKPVVAGGMAEFGLNCRLLRFATIEN